MPRSTEEMVSVGRGGAICAPGQQSDKQTNDTSGRAEGQEKSRCRNSATGDIFGVVDNSLFEPILENLRTFKTRIGFPMKNGRMA